MLARKLFFAAIFGLLFAPTLHANLRAPIRIEHAAARLVAPKSSARVLGESLEFHCPEAYTGKHNYEKFEARVCKARVRYRIDSPGERLRLQFVFSGNANVVWRLADKMLQSQALATKPAAKTECRFCPESMQSIQTATQEFDFAKGESTLEIQYEQSLSYSESGHGYFSASKWQQSFTYELWPLAEWQWGDSVTADLTFTIAARSGFLGLGYKDDTMRCALEENEKSTELALAVAQVENDTRTATGRVALKKSPQRLRCWYAAG
ncbi:MAG: hypothetical protein JSR44_06725 [Spirochaetes bacterium]|nr:hypothetical protein [Spirochaetota bacterium]